MTKKSKTSRKKSSKEKKSSAQSNLTNEDDGEDNKSSEVQTKGKKNSKILKFSDALINMDYWHGSLPNEDTANLLKNDGDFLMRAYVPEDVEPGKAVPQLVLSIRWGSVIKNAVIGQEKNGFQINDMHFQTIKDLIDTYQIRKRPINLSGSNVVLEMPARRKPWELRHRMLVFGKELGTGSYGTVYKGLLTRDRQKAVEVAIKVLTEMTAEASNALWKEARVMQLYDHMHVVKLYGVTNDVEPYNLVMEFVNGGSVDQFLQKKGKSATIHKRIQIMYEAAIGLEYLHSKGCIHRDIACRNLLISTVVKVADFGLTRKSKSYKIDPDKPMNLRWIAPDVFTSEVVDKRTDVYAYGVTLYETFTQPYAIPYADWDAAKVFDNVVESGYRLSPPPIMPEPVGELMGECLDVPENRPDFKTIIVCMKDIMKNPNKKLGHNL